MPRQYNLWSFYLCLFCIIISSYALYSTIRQTWIIAPPNYVLLLFTIIALILGIIGFKDKTNWLAKLRSWLTVLLSLLLIIILFFSVLFTSFFSMGKVLIKTTLS
ncbi:hypothetical protein LG329_15885 [Virgibacillus necropolis]|uniref:hypothetical protein n=1 Tax=Virgibacillus necropolis TaxID=163877 RepID=UPI00385009D4